MNFPLMAVDLAINARAQVAVWEVCRVVGATGRDGEPNGNALCLWGYKSLAEVGSIDLMAWGCCVGTGLFFTGYYAAMNEIIRLSKFSDRDEKQRVGQSECLTGK